MERVRVGEFKKSNIRLWMNQSYCSLGFLSQKSLWKLSTFCGYKGIYSRACEECEKSFFCKTGVSGDSLVTGTSCEFQSQNNWLVKLSFLSYSAPAVMTLQLPACFTCVAFWQVNSCESLARTSCEKLFECTHTWILHTLSHTTLIWFPPKYRVSNCWITSKFGT